MVTIWPKERFKEYHIVKNNITFRNAAFNLFSFFFHNLKEKYFYSFCPVEKKRNYFLVFTNLA